MSGLQPHMADPQRLCYRPTVDHEQSRHFRAIFEQHGHLVFRRAHALLGNTADAEEATQEVFVRAMQRYESFRSQSSVSTWLYSVTTNYCLNQLRDRKRRGELLRQNSESVKPNAPRSASAAGLVLLRQMLAEAEPKAAQAAVYVYLDGMSLQQAADALGISRRSVTNLLNRFREWARKRTAR